MKCERTCAYDMCLFYFIYMCRIVLHKKINKNMVAAVL